MNEIRDKLRMASRILHYADGRSEALQMIDAGRLLDEALALLPPEGETRRCPACDGNGVIETHPGYAPEGCTLCEGTGAAEPAPSSEKALAEALADPAITEALGWMDSNNPAGYEITEAACRFAQFIRALKARTPAAPQPSPLTLQSQLTIPAEDGEPVYIGVYSSNFEAAQTLLRRIEEALSQPSPQGEDAEAFRKRMVMRFQAMRRQYRDEGRTEWLDDAEADWVMDALRARLASSEAEIQHRIALAIEEHEGALCPEDMGCAEYIASLKTALASAPKEVNLCDGCSKWPCGTHSPRGVAGSITTECANRTPTSAATIAELQRRLASAQSSAQGEEARE